MVWELHYDYDKNLMEEILFGFYLSLGLILTGIIALLFFIIENPKSSIQSIKERFKVAIGIVLSYLFQTTIQFL